MSLQVVRPEWEHLVWLMDRWKMDYLRPFVSKERIEEAAKGRYCFTAISSKIGVAGVAGVTEYYPGRGECWAILSPGLKSEMLQVHRVVRRFIDMAPYRRLEAVVDVSFAQGHRWMKMLGFQVEAERLRYYTPDGRDVRLYSKIKESV